LESRSPLAVCIALEAIRRASQMSSLSQVLEQDLRLAAAMADSADFVEGVRALLIDRDNAPRWRHQSLAEVDPAEVARVFSGHHEAATATPERQRLPRLEPAENAAAPPREDDVE
jgi:enoyl-CoA hydratase